MSDKTETPEVEDLIRYDILAQEALRGVVKKVLQEVARTGLPGEHHFYVTFDTNASGVRMSSRMKDKYPDEMTIVIQHQYWDLETTDSGFSIGLSFDNVPETMLIPYSAIRGFFDPAVQFGLQFDAGEEGELQEIATDSEDGSVSALPSPPEVKKIGTSKAKSGTKAKDKSDDQPDSSSDDDAQSDQETSADVVSLDAFRKK